MLFGKLADMAQNTISLSVDEAVFQSVSRKPIQDTIIEMNTRKQLYARGVDSDNRSLASIGGGYSDFTMSLGMKRSRNLVDLRDTGDFYESFRVKPLKEGGFLIEADAQKEDTDLTEEWGDKIIGLTDLSKEVLGKEMIPYMRDDTLETLLE